MIAAPGARRFYFRFMYGPIRKRTLVRFLHTLHRTIGEVWACAYRRLKSMQRRVNLIASFWKQSGLTI
ncbi:hypothetical protein ASE07_10000 [Noviherbaspirillum sp. Root189]|nr:hypothetical protein ASE07_10000 [Noviherbaspirillum sp. Root189]